jgi:transcriptional regulator
VVAVKDMERADQIRTLRAAGFSQQEIAGLLHTTGDAVKGILFRAKKRRG